MNDTDPQQFDDPALKDALRKAISGETAPPLLRQRVSQSLGASSRRPWRPILAAAAILIIGFGLAWLLRSGEQPAPQWFADAMVVTHDQAAALPDHRLPNDLGNADPDAIRQRLVEKVGHPVMAATIGDGWTLASAGVSEVSRIPAAHLLFTRGGQTLSIFSISAGAVYQSGSSKDVRYSQIAKSHEVAGFVYGGAVHCLVAYDPSGNLTLRETIHLRDQLREKLGMTASN